MPLQLICPQCSKKMNIPDNLAGKKVRCPGCQVVLAVPGDSNPEPARNDSAPVEKKKKKKKKKKNTTERTAMTIAGMDMSVGQLFTYIGIGLALIGVIVLLFVFAPGLFKGGKPDIEVVEAYAAINGLGYRGAEKLISPGDALLKIPGGRKIIVTRPNPEGEYLLMKLRIPNSEVDKFFEGSRDRVILNNGVVSITANGKIYNPLFVQYDCDNTRGYFLMDFAGTGDSRLEDYIGPRPPGQETSMGSTWGCPGSTKKSVIGLEFTTNAGMQVKIDAIGSETSSTMPDLSADKIRSSLEGKKVPGEIFVAWNRGSQGNVMSMEVEQPNDISTTWIVECLFQRPKDTKDVTLQYLRTVKKLKLP